MLSSSVKLLRYPFQYSGPVPDFRSSTVCGPGVRALNTFADLQTVNAQVAFNFLPLINQNLEAYVDILNVLGVRTVTDVAENDGTDFGVVRGRQEPLRVRFGFRNKY